MPPKQRQRVSFPGLLKKQDGSKSADEDPAESPSQSIPPGSFLRRRSALAAESRLAANSARPSFSRSSNPRSSGTTSSAVRSHKTTSTKPIPHDLEGSPTSRSVLQKQGLRQISRPGLRDRAPKRTKYGMELASDADSGDGETPQTGPKKSVGAIRAARWRAKQKELKEQAMRRKLESSSSDDEAEPEPYIESVREILSRSPPRDEPEYISNATVRAGFKGLAPLISGTTIEEKTKIEQELWEKGKLEISEKYHPEYLKAKTQDSGNFAKHLFYEGLDPKSKAPSIAGVDEDPLELDPPGRGGPFDALKFPGRLVEQLNRDDKWTVNNWGVTALNKVPAHLMIQVKPEVLAQMPDEVLNRQQQGVRDKLPEGHILAQQPRSQTELSATSSGPSSARNSTDVLGPKRDESGKLLEAPLRGYGGRFLSKAERAIFAASSTLPPPSSSKSSGYNARTAEPAKPERRKSSNQYTKARQAKEAAAAAFAPATEPKSIPRLQAKLKTCTTRTVARVVHIDSSQNIKDGPIGKGSLQRNSTMRIMAEDTGTFMDDGENCDQCQDMGVKCNGGYPQCHWCCSNGLYCSFQKEAEAHVRASATAVDSDGSVYEGEAPKDKDVSKLTGKRIAKATSNAVEALETVRTLDLDPVSYNLHATAPRKGEAGHISPGHAIGYSHNELPHPQLPHDPKYVRGTRAYNPVQQEENFVSRPSIRITIPDHLKNLLVDDWENVTKSLLLVPLPSQAPANYVIDSYFEDEKTSRRLGSAEAEILEEFCAGLKVYFEKSIGKILLYRFERSQLAEVRKLWESGRYADWENRGPGDCYGAEHLTRMLVNMPELIAQTNMDAQSVARLKEEISKFCVWLARNSTKYFVAKYEKPSAEYVENAR